MASFKVSTYLMHTSVFSISRLQRHLEKWLCTVFNIDCAESKNNKIIILGSKLANGLTKALLGITFVEIGCNWVIMLYKVTLLYINQPILILEWKYYFFHILLGLGWRKLYKTIFQGVLEDEKLKKQKCASNWLKPHNSPFQIWCPCYAFVNNFSNSNPRIKILLFLNSTKTGLLKNVQKHLSGCFGSRERRKTKVGTFFWNTL